MNSEQLQRESWTGRGWLGFVIVIFAMQLAATFLLANRSKTSKPKSVSTAPTLIAAQLPAELAELENPTIFALPSRNGFSGAAWLDFSFVHHEAADWTEPPRWLALPANELGMAFKQLIRPDSKPSEIAQKIEPEISLPRLPAPDAELSLRSTFRVEGPLANRSLMEAFKLSSQTNANLLTNSIVQVIVNPAGFTWSANLLTSSGDKKADDDALALSKAARFEPLLPSQMKNNGGLTFGKIIFDWHTTTLSETNSL